MPQKTFIIHGIIGAAQQAVRQVMSAPATPARRPLGSGAVSPSADPRVDEPTKVDSDDEGMWGYVTSFLRPNFTIAKIDRTEYIRGNQNPTNFYEMTHDKYNKNF